MKKYLLNKVFVLFLVFNFLINMDTNLAFASAHVHTTKNNITEVDITNIPSNQTITAGKSIDFNRTILNTVAGKSKTFKGITRWEIKDDTAGVSSISDTGEVFATNKGYFLVRAICFQSKESYKKWLEDKRKNSKYITASSKWYRIKVKDSKGAAFVKNQSELDKAIKSSLFTQITLITKKEITFTINQGNYSNMNLIVNAPNAEIINYAVFNNINIQAIKDNTWEENAIGNIFRINSLKIRIVVNNTAEIKEISLEHDNTIFNLEVYGIVHMVSIRRPSSINLSGDSKKLAISLGKTGERSRISTCIPISAEVSGEADFLFSPGSEGSTINNSDKTIVVKVKNDSKQSVIITTNHTDEEIINAGETGPNSRDSQQPAIISGPIGFPGFTPVITPSEDLSTANVSPSTTSPMQFSSFSLGITGAKDSNGANLSGNLNVKVTSNNNSEGTSGVIYNQALGFTDGIATIPIELKKAGLQTLTIEITGVKALITTIVTVQVDTKGAYITKVSYVDATHLLLSFDEAVDSVTAHIVENYTLSGTFGLAGHPIQADAVINTNMVLLTVSKLDSITDGQTVVITASGVKDKDGNLVDPLHNSGVFIATGVHVVGLDYIDTTHIKVGFNVALDKATAEDVPNYTLGGTFGLTGHPNQAVLGGINSNEVTLTVNNMSSNTKGLSVSIIAVNIKDLSGNIINPIHNNYTKIIDNIGAYVTKLDYVDTTHIKLHFDEPLDIITAQDVANYTLGGTFGLSGQPDEAILGGTDNNEVMLTVDDMTSIINGQTVFVTVSNVKDLAGNTINNNHNSAHFITDITGAYVDHIEYVDSTHIKVVFDETVEETTANNVNNYTLGGTFGLTGHPSQAVLGGADYKEVVLTVNNMSTIADGQSIAITVSNVEDLAGNSVDSANNSDEIFADKAGAYVTKVNIIDNTHISVIFDEPLDVNTAQNVTNYTLGGTFGFTGHPSQVVLGGADHDEVILTVGDMSLINDGQTISVTVANVEDLAGNPVDKDHSNAQFIKYLRGAHVTKLEYANTTQIKVLFDEPLDLVTAQNAGNYTLGGTFGLAGHPTQAVLGGAGNNEVTLTINDMSSILDGQTVSVIVANVEDLDGNPVDAANNKAELCIDNTGAYVTSLKYVDATHIKVIYNESIDATTAQNVINYALSGTFGLTGNPNQAVLGGANHNEVTLTVGDMSSITDNQTVLVTVSNVKDIAGNLVDTGHNSADFIIDHTGANVVSIAYVDTTHLTVIFNEALDITTAQNAANYTLGNALHGNPSQAVLGGNNNEVTLTLSGLTEVSEGQTVSITVANVKDLVGNPVESAKNYAEITMDYTGAYVSNVIQYIDATHIKVVFDEELDLASAQDVTNYALSGTFGLTGNPSQAVLGGADKDEVTLTISDMSSMIAGQTISVKVDNVKDLFDNPVDPGNNNAYYTKK